jgi:hypothetical protein
LILVPVVELLQVTVPTQFVAVNVAKSLPHTKFLFEAITGTVGVTGCALIVTLAEAAELQAPDVAVTV